MEKKIKVTTLKQFEILIAELENKPSLAKGFQRSSTPNNFKKEWEEIATKLNSVGPPIRDSEGWQKVWRDFKCKLKKKLTHNKAEINATGGGTYKQLPLSHLEEAAANFLQFEKQLSPAGKLQGIASADDIQIENNISDLDVTILEDDENVPSTSTNVRKRKRTMDERKELFEKHNAIHKEAFHEISETITEIKTVLKDSNRNQEKLCETQENTLIEIKTMLKETNRYQRKLYEVEEKKLKVMEKQSKREETLFESEIKLKNIKMEIKKKELEVLRNQYD